MKVALLGPYPSQIAGGVDAVVAALAQGLVRRPEVNLHVLSAVPGLNVPKEESRPGLTLHLVPHPRGDRLLWHLPIARVLCQILARIAPDVVHAHMASFYADAALRSGRPAVITPHGIIFREAALAQGNSSLPAQLRWLLDMWYERWVLRRAKDLVAISPYVAQEFRRLTKARFHDIENPVADSFFELPSRDTRVDGQHRLLCVARVIPRKDILTLLQAFVLVKAECPGASLDIAGDMNANPDYSTICTETASKLGLGTSVRFLGDLQGAALLERYAAADLVTLTSRQETAPVTIAEAMAAGRAVVATNVGGVSFMVANGRTGLLTAPGDAHNLASAAITLLADDERRARFGRMARLEAERRFRLKAIVERTMTLYSDLIQDCSIGSSV